VPAEQHQEIGRKAGEAARISMEATLGIDPLRREKWQEVFKRLRIQGLGDFYKKDKYIIIKAPYINNQEVQRGYLEALLGVNLENRTSNPPFVYEVTS
ncbi:MAG: hypothetical protein JSV64_02600, partial [Candidatus Bathyarchaeota archaeon]